jgi:beta-glucosidase
LAALLSAVYAALVFPLRIHPQQGAGQPAYRNVQLPVEQRVADLMGRMTLEEKVAQTHALWQRKSLIMDAPGNFAPEKAREVLKNGIG